MKLLILTLILCLNINYCAANYWKDLAIEKGEIISDEIFDYDYDENDYCTHLVTIEFNQSCYCQFTPEDYFHQDILFVLLHTGNETIEKIITTMQRNFIIELIMITQFFVILMNMTNQDKIPL